MIENSKICVLFHIPEDIQEGLLRGTLVRNGGVIQNTENGQVVSWLREIGENAPQKSGVISSVPPDAMSAQLACGFGMVITVQLACTFYLATKIEKLEKKIDQLYFEIKEVEKKLDHLHLEHLLDTIKPYYEAYAAFKEGEYDEGKKLARKARADIMAYISNMPSEVLFSDKNGFMLLVKTLISSLTLQLECERLCDPDKICRILSHYTEELKYIEKKIKEFIANFKQCVIPKSEDYLQAFVNLSKDKEMSAFRKFGLPAGIQRLEQEIEISKMLKTVPQEEIDKQTKLGAQAIYFIPRPTIKAPVEMLAKQTETVIN